MRCDGSTPVECSGSSAAVARSGNSEGLGVIVGRHLKEQGSEARRYWRGHDTRRAARAATRPQAGARLCRNAHQVRWRNAQNWHKRESLRWKTGDGESELSTPLWKSARFVHRVINRRLWPKPWHSGNAPPCPVFTVTRSRIQTN